MTDETSGEPLDVIALPEGSDQTFETPMEAWKASIAEEKKSTAESAETATAEKELAKANPESPEEMTTEEDQENDPAKPAIDPPKSWTKDLHEHWSSLDPVLQERIVARDREDQAAIKRAFNEAADDRKAVKAEHEAAEQARKQYEAQLPALMQSLQDAQQSAFSDIRTVDDVTKLAAEDPFRYLQWQAHQTKLQAVNAEVEKAKGQQTQKQQSEWAEHVQRENALAIELIPELADKDKGAALMKRAGERLSELGFKRDELNDLSTGKQKLSVFDHRFQQLIADSLKLADIQKAPKAIAAKNVPPVQRPGVSRAPGASNTETTKALETKLTNSGDLRDAMALYNARQSSRRAS